MLQTIAIRSYFFCSFSYIYLFIPYKSHDKKTTEFGLYRKYKLDTTVHL